MFCRAGLRFHPGPNPGDLDSGCRHHRLSVESVTDAALVVWVLWRERRSHLQPSQWRTHADSTVFLARLAIALHLALIGPLVELVQ